MSGMTFGYLGKPYSTAAITGSYTIPAGYFAVVAASCKDGGSVSVGGTTVLHSSSNTWSVLGSSPLKYDAASGNNALSTSPAGTGTPTSGAFASATAQSTDSNSNEFTAAEGTVINGSGTWAAVVSLYPAN